MLLVPISIELPAPELVWGLFLRGLGVVYFIAIAQLYHQVLPLAGARGFAPVHHKIAQIKIDYPGWRGWLYFPTLLLLNASDRFMKALIVLGTASALLVVYGGPLSILALFICWIIYLSFDIAVGLPYPWDSLLLEASFLSLFLPTLSALPALTISALPLPAVAWAYSWLFFRLMFGFGKYKFIGGSLRDTGYFKNFMISIPLPSYLAWYAYRLPRWVFQVVLLIVFTTEVVLPFGVFVPGYTPIVVALVTACLMVGIQLVSSFGYFNILTIVLCIPLLAIQSSLFDTSFSMVSAHWITHLVILVLAVGGLINLPFNSWCNQTWLYWPSLMRVHIPGIQALLRFYRALSRFRLVHSYGVFPPKSSVPIHWVPVIEGTQDGQEWKPYEYRYITTTETTPPRFVAPYHPRLDHGIFYESFGTNDANFAWSTMGSGNPYDFAHSSVVECLMQRLLEGEPSVLSLFRSSPFSPDSPPTQTRVTLYRFQPTTPEERRRTGRWWIRTVAGTHLPPTRLNKQVWQQRQSVPELFHPDAVLWKRRSPHIRALQTLARSGSIDQLWPAITTGLTTDLAVFWHEFVPLIEASGKSWDAMPQMVDQLRTSYTWQQCRELELLLNRLSLALLEKIEPYFLKKSTPQLVVSEYFQLYLLTHHIISKGPSVYASALADPTQAIEYVSDFNPESSFYYLALFWFDTLVFQARKFRLAMQIANIQWGNGLPGFLELIPFLSKQFLDASQENLPILDWNPKNGEWLVTEKQPEPGLYAESDSLPLRS